MSIGFRRLAQAVKASATVVQVARWFGYDYSGHGRFECPMCRSVSKSRKTLALFEDDRKWHCFHCNAGGDTISWIAAALDCSAGSALNILVARLGVDPDEVSIGAYLRAIAAQREELATLAVATSIRRAVQREYWGWTYRTTMMEPAELVEWCAAWDDLDLRAGLGVDVECDAKELRVAREAWRAFGGTRQFKKAREPITEMIASRKWDGWARHGLYGLLARHVTAATEPGSKERKQIYALLDTVDVTVSFERGGTGYQKLSQCVRGRAVFCIRDLGGRACGFAGRATKPMEDAGEPKYVNSRDTDVFYKRRSLYPIEQAASHIAREGYAVVVEGYADAIALHNCGVKNAVATMGSRLTEEQARLIQRLAPVAVVMLDGDDAGQKGTVAALQAAAAVGLRAEVARLPPGADPDDVAREPGGGDRLALKAARAAQRANTRGEGQGLGDARGRIFARRKDS